MRKTMETNGMFYYMPMCQLNQIITEMKQALAKNYEKVCQSVNHTEDENSVRLIGSKSIINFESGNLGR